MVCSRFEMQMDDKEALKHFLVQVLSWHTGRNDKDEFNTLRISTSGSDLYWNSHVKESLNADNVELVCMMCRPYKLNKQTGFFDHRMFIEGKKEDGHIIWKQSSYDYLWEIIEDMMGKSKHNVIGNGGDGSSSEAWGILHDYHGTFIYKHSQYYGK